MITPSGYFHPSCVWQLAEGDALDAEDLATEHADGSRENIPACEYPDYTARGEIAIEGSGELWPPVINKSWIEDAETTIDGPYGELDATWTVPPAPTSDDQQVFGFFPGLQKKHDLSTPILQPVLSWNAYFHDFPDEWDIHSEYCCPKNNDMHSTPVMVHPGDKIKGFIRQTCAAGTSPCPTWKVTTMDVTQNNKTTFPIKKNAVIFDWAFAGALEVIQLTQCSDYPPNSGLISRV